MIGPITVKRLHPNATLPQRQTAGAIGYDLYACLDEPVVVPSVWRTIVSVVFACIRGVFASAADTDFLDAFTPTRIPTGIAIAIPPGYGGEVRPRSSSLFRGLLIEKDTIDPDSRGQVFVQVLNVGAHPVTIQHGERIAQLVFCRVATPDLVEGDLDETERGAGGFGSTGR